MIRRIASGTLALVVVVSVVLVCGGSPLAAAPTFAEILVCTQVAEQTRPDISGGLVVWEDLRNLSSDIYGLDLTDRAEITISPKATAQNNPAVSGDTTVWQDNRNSNWDIYGHDMTNGQTLSICTQAAGQYSPDISGDIIVWKDDRNASTDIYGYDLTTGQEFPICTQAVDQEYPAVSGDLVVWTDYRNGNGDIYGYDLATGQTFPICTQGADQFVPAVSGDLIVWEDHRNASYDIYGYDLSTGQTIPICTQAADQYDPAVSGDLVVWTDHRNASDDIYGYDLSTGQTIPICTQAADQTLPAVSGDIVVWDDERNATHDIYGADFALDPERVAGANRFETAVAISRAHPTFSSQAVILATGRDFPDALSAAGLAGAYHAPLLLVELDSVPAGVTAELARIQPQKVILIGGTSAISAGVEATLRKAGYDVQRIAGANRYETSQLIAEEIAVRLGPRFEGKAFVVRGDAFPDALSVSPIAYNRKTPILLTRTGSLAPETADALSSLDIQTAVIAGGTGAVSTSVEAAVTALTAANGGDPTVRWSGSDRYTTSAIIANEAQRHRLASVGFVGLATGLNFPDALAGGVACGQEHGVLLLTPPTGLPTDTRNHLVERRDGVGAMEAFGGTSVLPDAVLTAAKVAVNG